ncbi:cation-transporting ATPase F [Saccharopolyspora kobensis]|uniref:Cation-transporting ATPase F n=1 Tax=Saccharopolyspora kobensis TaxID=146035 RepID=A0A1H5V8G8_9PSEU|nr:cation-transporting ATPase F [Saccharopolyspora kobensis]SFC64856.1 cation-transporting ATPase F [Saccharopolyspora kobensis]
MVRCLRTDACRGLTTAEADRRRDRFGPNALPRPGTAGPVVRLFRQVRDPLVYVLLVAGVVTLAFGESVDAGVIFGVVVLNTIIGFVEESKAESALDALRKMVRAKARTLREGREWTIAAEDLVPGDVVLVEAGDQVPADMRVIRAADLHVDESALTGESAPVIKEHPALPEPTVVADRRNMLHSGTLVTAGSGAAVAVATGAATELGKIYLLLGAAEKLATPLTRKLAWFSKVLTVAILALAVMTFGIGVARGQGAVEMFTAAVALAVGAIPEGLPAAVTITLAIGVGRMARRRAVIRRLPAVETLGSTTVIGSDKTGTLTENQMTVQCVWTPDGRFDVTGSGYSPDGEVVGRPRSEALRWCLLAGAGCNDAALAQRDGRPIAVGDPTEAAMLVVAHKADLELHGAELTRVATIPFTSDRQYMATLHEMPDGDGRVVLAKGAVERLLVLCGSEMASDGTHRPIDRRAALVAADELARTGLRVLATAMKPVAAQDGLVEKSMPGTLVLTGLQAMFDPPRGHAADAVRACREAGIKVTMITGDHAGTATSIARRIGLLGAGAHAETLTGAELAALPEREWPAAVDRASVFARVSPEQKLRLVKAFQARGHVVAMTGDGVNDAPALRQADIGVAMGLSGTEVAKEAADMVLTDDDFATIEAAVEEGRGAFDNLTKFIVWTLPTNMAEGLVILAAIVVGSALPILPTQILWINMTTAVALGLMLAFEPKEAGSMQRPPRDPGTPLLTGALVQRILLVSVLLVGGSWWLFEWAQATGATLPEARTAAVNFFVAVEVAYLFSCRSLNRSIWSIGVLGNRWVVGGVTVQAAGQLAITYLPVFNSLFHTAPISMHLWSLVLGLSLLAWLVIAADKRLRRHFDQAAPAGPRSSTTSVGPPAE